MALELLFKNRWINKKANEDDYYYVLNEIDKYRDFINEKLGYKLIITPQIIKLEKVPGQTAPWMGVQDFKEILDYQLFSMTLMFLEDKSYQEQFVLSELTDFIQQYYPLEEGLNWENYQNRMSLIRVLRYAMDEGLFIHLDGLENDFRLDASSDILYESTGLSRYFMRQLNQPLVDRDSLLDGRSEISGLLDSDRGVIRRQRVYRKLTLQPAVYKSSENDEDFIYIKTYRASLEKDMEEFFDGDLHIHRNSAYLILSEESKTGELIPGRRIESDVSLLVNQMIRDKVEKGDWHYDNNDMITVTRADFDRLLMDCREKYGDRFTKGLEEASSEEYISRISEYMTNLDLIEINYNDQVVTIKPICAKLVAHYEGGSHE